MLSFSLTIGAVARNALSVALTSADCVGADTALVFDLVPSATFAVVATLFVVCFFTAIEFVGFCPI
jgi:hypothetical protein